jgi:uncharacterized membrane protein YgaE (UPF0421/DUF939 family)
VSGNEAAPRPGRIARGEIVLRASAARVSASLPAVLQLVFAITAAYAIAHYLLAHPYPITAVTVTLSSLGLVLDARPKRVLETAIAMTAGIVLSELILLAFGQGIWQFALTVLVALVAARAMSPNPGLAIVATVQASLVSLMPVPVGGPFSRTVDGLIGGAVALVCTALIPRDPRRAARRGGRRFFAAFTTIVSSLVTVVRLGDQRTAEIVLGRARETQPLIDEWKASVDSAVAIARISPFYRRRRAELAADRELQNYMDLAARNLRVVTRRLSVLLLDERPRPEIAGMLSGIEASVNMLAQSIEHPELRPIARQSLVLVATGLDPRTLLPDQPVSEAAAVLAMRPLVLDLLGASGLDPEAARSALPDLSV